MKKTTFALYFGNRGFFPGELVASAREKMVKVCEENGYGYLIMDESLTRYGAIETIAEGKLMLSSLKNTRENMMVLFYAFPTSAMKTALR